MVEAAVACVVLVVGGVSWLFGVFDGEGWRR
jgi:hypothetical protein